MPGLTDSDWYAPTWLDDVLDGAALAFDKACERWRDLYRAAIETRDTQNRVIGDASRTADDRERAKRLRAEAESQLELLRGDGDTRTFQSDFYSYRYFASEGFLPGYSFPRLPLSAYIPGRGGAGKRDEYLSRPRFLAISEFGPRSIVYHEGSRYLINRVMLPAERSETNKLVMGRTKRCEACAYLHPLEGDDPGPDLCRRCETPLPPATEKLFRLQNVSTKRRDRINSDEEERQRQGFEIRTGVRFAEHGGKASARSARVVAAGDAVLKLEYGSSATIWRINVGWRRRANRDQLGFVLDTERGFWQKNDQDPDDLDDAMSQSRERVVPYVEDRRNVLLLEPSKPLDLTGMASLAAALKNAVQVEYPARRPGARDRAAPVGQRSTPAASLRVRRGRGRRAPAPGSRARRRGSPRADRARALPLRPAHWRGPSKGAGRTRGLRGGLLRLPDELRQSARPPGA